MNTKTFRIILTASWLSPIIAISIHLATFRSMPPEIQSFVHSQPLFTASSIIVLIAGFVSFVAAVVGYVGLYTWRFWGRWLYLIAAILNVVIMPVDRSPAIYSSAVACLLTLSYILTGVIIGVAYFNPSISERFKKPMNAQPAGSGYRPPAAGSA